MNLTLWDLLSPLLPKDLLPKAMRPARPAKPNLSKQLAPNPSTPPAIIAPEALPQYQATQRPKPPRSTHPTKTLASTRASSPASTTQSTAPSGPAKQLTAAERYELVTRQMLDRYGIRVRKWRSSMSGVAWYVTYRDGSVARLIEAPKPKGPMSAAIFLHEIGHHAIGFNRYKPRCLEEYHAWAWAIEQMQATGIEVTDAVQRRMHQSLHYAVQKARRRGLRALPEELLRFCEPPPKSRRRRAG